MRIIAGKYRGRQIAAPKGDGTRPTTDRVREALMSSLASLMGSFEGGHVLDAFAGTGALGLEALSRGASTCTFFERSPRAAAVLKKNIAAIGIPGGAARVVEQDVTRAVARHVLPGAPFTLVFLDPPYAMPAGEVAGLIGALAAAGGIDDGAIVVYEHEQGSYDHLEGPLSADFDEVAVKHYGKTEISVLEWKGAQPC